MPYLRARACVRACVREECVKNVKKSDWQPMASPVRVERSNEVLQIAFQQTVAKRLDRLVKQGRRESTRALPVGFAQPLVQLAAVPLLQHEALQRIEHALQK